MTGFFSRGFQGKRREPEEAGRTPPGQYLTKDFPVVSAGPTPRTPVTKWDFSITGAVDQPMKWTWDQFRALPVEKLTRDIHCVTRWSKLDTTWEGVSLDYLFEQVGVHGDYLVASCDGGYTTNMPIEDVTGGKAWVVFNYENAPIDPEHGGPAPLLVPQLYFWKSAKWVRGLKLVDEDEPGFWEQGGYHNHGDPWKEQRMWGD